MPTSLGSPTRAIHAPETMTMMKIESAKTAARTRASRAIVSARAPSAFVRFISVVRDAAGRCARARRATVWGLSARRGMTRGELDEIDGGAKMTPFARARDRSRFAVTGERWYYNTTLGFSIRVVARRHRVCELCRERATSPRGGVSRGRVSRHAPVRVGERRVRARGVAPRV